MLYLISEPCASRRQGCSCLQPSSRGSKPACQIGANHCLQANHPLTASEVRPASVTVISSAELADSESPGHFDHQQTFLIPATVVGIMRLTSALQHLFAMMQSELPGTTAGCIATSLSNNPMQGHASAKHLPHRVPQQRVCTHNPATSPLSAVQRHAPLAMPAAHCCPFIWLLRIKCTASSPHHSQHHVSGQDSVHLCTSPPALSMAPAQQTNTQTRTPACSAHLGGTQQACLCDSGKNSESALSAILQSILCSSHNASVGPAALGPRRPGLGGAKLQDPMANHAHQHMRTQRDIIHLLMSTVRLSQDTARSRQHSSMAEQCLPDILATEQYMHVAHARSRLHRHPAAGSAQGLLNAAACKAGLPRVCSATAAALLHVLYASSVSEPSEHCRQMQSCLQCNVVDRWQRRGATSLASLPGVHQMQCSDVLACKDAIWH